MEKRLLQITIALAALVPIFGGAAGVLAAPMMGSGFGDSQFHYLSGLLVGVGMAYWMLVPRIEREGSRLFLLTLIVVVGGFCRAVGLLMGDPAGRGAYAALVMELIVTPAVYLWQTRLAVPASMDAPSPGR